MQLTRSMRAADFRGGGDSATDRSVGTIGFFQLEVLRAIRALGDRGFVSEVVNWFYDTRGRRVAVPQAYLAVTRLEAKGLLRARIVQPEARVGGRSRRSYSLTGAGKSLLDANLSASQATSACTSSHRKEPIYEAIKPQPS